MRDRDGEILYLLDGCMFLTTESNEQLFFVFDLLFKLGRLIAHYFPTYYTYMDISTSSCIANELDSAFFERVVSRSRLYHASSQNVKAHQTYNSY